MKKFFLVLLLGMAVNADDLISIESPHTVDQSVENLKTILPQKGFQIFGIINHQKNADAVNMQLNGLTVIIFGNPAAGTKLMQENPLSGLDLPLKLIVYEDKTGKTKFAFRSSEWLKSTYTLKNNDQLLTKMNATVREIISEAMLNKENND